MILENKKKSFNLNAGSSYSRIDIRFYTYYTTIIGRDKEVLRNLDNKNTARVEVAKRVHNSFDQKIHNPDTFEQRI